MMKKAKVLLVSAIFTMSSMGGAASITESSDKTKSDNKKGQLLNIAMGGANLYQAKVCFSQCSASGGGCCAMAPVFLLMGIQNLQQAGAQGKTAGQAAGAVGLTDAGLGSSDYDPEAIKQLENDPEYREGKDFVATVANGGANFTYDPKTNSVTTAKGNKIKGSDLNSTSGMAAAGMPKGAIDLLSSMESDILAKAQKKVDKMGRGSSTNVLAGEESGGGGSGGDGITSGSGDEASHGVAGAAGGTGLGIDRDPAQVAGMQKNYNGEPIGVAGDSIFSMMTRRYKAKENQSSFFDGSELLIQK